RSLPAGRARIWRNAGDPGKNGGAGRVEPLDHNQIRSGGARYRFAAENFRAFFVNDTCDCDDGANSAGADAGTARAAPGFAFGSSAEAARSWDQRGGERDANFAGPYGQRGRSGCPDAGRTRLRRTMDCGERAFSDAGVVEIVHEIFGG